MFHIHAKIIQRPPSVERIVKNIRYGTATGLTKTAKTGQSAVQDALKSKFTIRNKWFEQNTPLGIKVTPATKDSQKAEIKTAARFLPLQKSGGAKIPFGKYIAIPTKNARPNPRGRIPAAFLPKALIATGKAFIETFANGQKAISVHGLKRSGRYSDVVVMYILEPRAKIKPVDFWDGPITKVVKRDLTRNIADGIDGALRTMK